MNKEEVSNMWNDVIKFLSIGIIIHLLLYAVDDYCDLFSEMTLKLLLYLTLGLIIYHSIIKKMIDKHIINKESYKPILGKKINKKKNTKKMK
jgi:hypothetical protein